MKSLLPNDAKSRGRLGLLTVLLVLSGVIAAILWTNRIRGEEALKTADAAQLQEIVKSDPGNAKAQTLLGAKLEAKGDFAGATAAYKKAAELDGDSEAAWLGWSRVAQSSGVIQEAYSILDVYLKAHPQSVEGTLALAAFYHSQDALIRSLEMGQKASELDPNNVRAWRRVATEMLGLKRYPEASAAMTKALALVPEDWRSHYVLGLAQAGQGKTSEALASFQKANDFAPGEAGPLKELGKLQLAAATDDAGIQKALATLTDAQKADSQDDETPLLLGRAHIRRKEWKAAQNALEAAVRLKPTEPAPYFELANVYRKTGDAARSQVAQKRHNVLETYRRDAGNLLSMIYQEKGDVSLSNQTRMKLARLYAKYGDFNLAVREYKHLLARVPADETVKSELARVEQTLASAPPSPADAAAAETALLTQGDALREQGKFREAGRAYASILVNNRKSAPAYLGLGLSLLGEGNRDNAFRAFNAAIALDPNLDAAQFELARLYREMDFADECIRRLDPLLKKDPANAVYLNERGLAYQKVEVFGSAEENFAAAAAADPKNNEYRINLAFAQFKNAKFVEAEKNYRDAIQAEPQNGILLAFFGVYLAERSQATNNAALGKEAEATLKKSLTLAPDNFTASFALGNLYLNRGDAKAALPLLLSANRQKPEIIAPYYRLSLAYGKIGDKEKSAFYRKESARRSEYFNRRTNTEQLARERPKEAPLRLKLARIYAEGGDAARAVNQYQVYLNMTPKDATAKKELDALVKRVRNNANAAKEKG